MAMFKALWLEKEEAGFRASVAEIQEDRLDGLKSEVQHPASGKVHRCKPVRHTDSFSLRSA